MDQRCYSIGQLARKVSVSMRALRYYDRQGLLSPSQRSEGGYRLYTDVDLVKLQSIMALKFLGFSLAEIRGLVQGGPTGLHEVLAQQRAMMVEKRAQLDAIIAAIDRTEQLLQAGESDADVVAKLARLIEVMQMEQKRNWIDQYLTPQQRETMAGVVKQAYAPDALERTSWRRWSTEEHIRFQEEYRAFLAEWKGLVAAGADPASPEAQAIARRLTEFTGQLSQGDPEIMTGLRRTWEQYDALPESGKPQAYALSVEDRAFIRKALGILYGRKGAGEG